MRIIKKVVGIFCIIEAFAGICLFLGEVTQLTNITKSTDSGNVPAFAFILVSAIFALLAFRLLRKTPEEESKQLERKSKKYAYGTHISGLDIGKMPVSICLSKDGLLISAESIKKEFKLSLNKIENIGNYNEVEIEKHLKSSVAGGIIGAATFGVAGAVIGSRPKEKKTKKVISYILIDYSDGQIIIESNDNVGIVNIISYFRKLKPQANETTTIEL